MVLDIDSFYLIGLYPKNVHVRIIIEPDLILNKSNISNTELLLPDQHSANLIKDYIYKEYPGCS